jgi:Ca-activated chloride channel family protein
MLRRTRNSLPRLLLPGVLLLALTTFTGFAAGETDPGNLIVRVSDARGPLSGATVEVSSTTLRMRAILGTTDAHGLVEFNGLPAGHGYVVIVTKGGFASERAMNIEIRPGKTKRVEIRLTSRGDRPVEAPVLQETEALVGRDAAEPGKPSGVAGDIRAQHEAMSQGFVRTPSYKKHGHHPPYRPGPLFNTESYDEIHESGFRPVSVAPLSTFSIDVDTASYSNVRRFLTDGQLPPPGAVRIEELINYFDYSYKKPDARAPFGIDVEINEAPWNTRHRLARIGLKGRELSAGQRPPCNIVFLLDVSGSMRAANKLPLVQRSMKMLVNELNARDQVSIVVYAGAAGLVLPPTEAADRTTIFRAIDGLHAGGSTAGGAGIQLAYKQARDAFIEEGVNRVVLATDGDFNVGVTDRSSLIRMIEREAKTGIALTALGFGMGNYKDSTLEQLADHGNGNYAYIDTLSEARKVLVEESGGTLVTIAKDVKIQVEFNPAHVSSYRLIGYENRALNDEDFNDDTKDAGEIGAGHTVTALYEIVPRGFDHDRPDVDPLKYQRQERFDYEDASEELLTVKVRWKAPDSDRSRKREWAVVDRGRRLPAASDDFRFAAAVAGFGMLLRDSGHSGDLTFEDVLSLAEDGLSRDPHGHRTAFLDLVTRADEVQRQHERRATN